jgi:hypothetical protein
MRIIDQAFPPRSEAMFGWKDRLTLWLAGSYPDVRAADSEGDPRRTVIGHFFGAGAEAGLLGDAGVVGVADWLGVVAGVGDGTSGIAGISTGGAGSGESGGSIGIWGGTSPAPRSGAGSLDFALIDDGSSSLVSEIVTSSS